MQPSPDAIVVGAGIVGAACALELAKAGLGVMVVDIARPGGGATAACMGHVVVMDDSEAQFALGHWSQNLWHKLVPRFAESPEGRSIEHDPCGTLWVAEDAEELQAVRQKHAFYSRRGVDAEILDAQGVGEAEPELRSGLAGGLRVPADSVIYPPAAVRWLLERAAEAGREHGKELRLRPCTGVESVRQRGAGAEVMLRDGSSIGAAWAVVCAGSASLELLPEGLARSASGRSPDSLGGHRIRPRKGHLIITDRRPGFCRHQLVELGYLKSAHAVQEDGPSENATAEEAGPAEAGPAEAGPAGAASVAFNLQPRATGQMLLGSSRQFDSTTPEVEPAVLARMIARGRHFMPRLTRLKAVRAWTGFRPATDDHLPLIGPVPGSKALIVAAGHEGLGITTSLGTAQLVADHALGRASEIDPTPYLPSRSAPGESHG